MKLTDKIALRPARLRDVGVLAEMFEAEFAAAVALLPEAWFPAGFDWPGEVKSVLRDPARRLLVAERNGRIVGYVHVRVTGTAAAGRRNRLRALLLRLRLRKKAAPKCGDAVGMIENCFVVPGFRRCGIGRALVDAALDWFAAQQVQRITLGVLANNAAAVQFWQQCGFSTYRFIMQRRI